MLASLGECARTLSVFHAVRASVCAPVRPLYFVFLIP